jgi:hypothetical protein
MNQGGHIKYILQGQSTRAGFGCPNVERTSTRTAIGSFSFDPEFIGVSKETDLGAFGTNTVPSPQGYTLGCLSRLSPSSGEHKRGVEPKQNNTVYSSPRLKSHTKAVL